MEKIEDKILSHLEAYNVKNIKPPKLLILTFKDYLELQEMAEEENKQAVWDLQETLLNKHYSRVQFQAVVDYSYGKMYLGMIITFDYDATEIIIKGLLE